MRTDPEFAFLLRRQVRDVLGDPAYLAWLGGGLSELQPFRLDRTGETGALHEAGLAGDGALKVKVNAIGDRVFVTDGVWVRPNARVFPFTDESAALLRHVEERGLFGWADGVVDLATGCGHNVLAYAGRDPVRVAFDVSPRALAFCNLNRLLNEVPAARCALALNDVRDGIPEAVAASLGRRVLFLANMPFGPAPARGVLPPTSDGGASGADLQGATLDAIRTFAERRGEGREVRACLLALSVGDAGRDRWEVVELARERFEASRIEWRILEDEKVFRISGVRELHNPSPVAVAFPRIAACRLYVREAESAALHAAYADLAEAHARAGNPDIAYGVLDLTIG